MTVMSNSEAKRAKKEKPFERFHKITINGLLFASAILLVKARFDLKKMRILGVKELLIAGLAVAVAFFIDWRIDYEYGSMVEHTFMYPMIAAFWSIYFYSYYMTFSNKLTD